MRLADRAHLRRTTGSNAALRSLIYKEKVHSTQPEGGCTRPSQKEMPFALHFAQEQA